MQIDENTKVIGRFHSKPSPRGLNIYNPLFEELKINAVYLLFYNQNPKVLIDGMRKLNLAGAISAGFESDTKIPKLLDKVDEVAKFVGRVGFITNRNGELTGHVQSGEGMYRTVFKAMNPVGKKIVIIGAGNVAKAMLYYISKLDKHPKTVEIYNRDTKKAKVLKKTFKIVSKIGSLDEAKLSNGDILVNVSELGGSQPDNFFTKEIVNNFKAVADVTFEIENTNLIKLAKKMHKKYATGWDMFTYQGQVVLETILEQKIPFDVLKKHVIKGLSDTVK